MTGGWGGGSVVRLLGLGLSRWVYIWGSRGQDGARLENGYLPLRRGGNIRRRKNFDHDTAPGRGTTISKKKAALMGEGAEEEGRKKEHTAWETSPCWTTGTAWEGREKGWDSPLREKIIGNKEMDEYLDVQKVIGPNNLHLVTRYKKSKRSWK